MGVLHDAVPYVAIHIGGKERIGRQRDELHCYGHGADDPERCSVYGLRQDDDDRAERYRVTDQPEQPEKPIVKVVRLQR